MDLVITAKKSPRFENNKIMWYEGDTFSLVWQINLMDENANPIDLSPLDEVVFRFTNSSRVLVQEFTVHVNSDQTITLNFNDLISSKFTAGTYYYSIKYKGTNVTTLATDGIVEVERCQ